MPKGDEGFYDRADEHIELSNAQISEAVPRGKVSASMMYANARFSAWVAATSYHSGEDMRAQGQERIDYFVDQFRIMLEENYSDYAQKFDVYMK